MKSLLRYCDRCQEYTLQDVCPRCGARTRIPIPPRFSPQDPYGKYRRMAKKAMREELSPEG